MRCAWLNREKRGGVAALVVFRSVVEGIASGVVRGGDGRKGEEGPELTPEALEPRVTHRVRSSGRGQSA
jgi:hypothetical protein